MIEKFIFSGVFILFAFFSYSLSVKASSNVIDSKDIKMPMHNPFWFFYKNKFHNKKICYIGGVIQLIILILALWGFPKYIFS